MFSEQVHGVKHHRNIAFRSLLSAEDSPDRNIYREINWIRVMSDDPDHAHGHGSVGDYSRGGDHVVLVTTATSVVETSPDYWWRPCPCQSGVGQSWHLTWAEAEQRATWTSQGGRRNRSLGASQESVLRGRPHNRSRPQHWSCSLLVGYQQLSEHELIVRPDHPAKPRHPFINISGLLQKDDVQTRVERSFLYNPEEAK